MPTIRIPVTTTGGAGVATGTGTSTFAIGAGFVEAIKVTYEGTAPATTDVAISEVSGYQTLLTLTDKNTSATFYPRHTTHSPTGVDTGAQEMYMVEGKLQVAVTGCNAITDAVVVEIRYMENNEVR